MTSLVNEFNAFNKEGKRVSELIEKTLRPLITDLLAEGRYSAREVIGIVVQEADLLAAEVVLRRSLDMGKKERQEARERMEQRAKGMGGVEPSRE